MKNTTPRFTLRRVLTLSLLSAAALVQSCSKESDSIAPQQPTTEHMSQRSSEEPLVQATAAGNLPIDPMSGPLGSEVNVIWADYYYSGVQFATPSARVELTGAAHIIIPHVYLASALGNGRTNGFTFTIPAYIPTGTYTFHVTADQPNASLVRQPGFPDAEGTLVVTQTSVTALTGLGALGGVTSAPPDASGGYTVNGRSFIINWFKFQYPTNTLVRFGLRSTNGDYYLLAKPSAQAISSLPYGSGFYSMNNLFNNANEDETFRNGARVIYGTNDVPSNTYTMYLDNYSTTYTSSVGNPNGGTITLP